MPNYKLSFCTQGAGAFSSEEACGVAPRILPLVGRQHDNACPNFMVVLLGVGTLILGMALGFGFVELYPAPNLWVTDSRQRGAERQAGLVKCRQGGERQRLIDEE